MLICVMLFSASAYANENQEMVLSDLNETHDNSEIMPLYTYIDVITAALVIDDNGRCVFSGSGTALDYDVKIEIYLQRSRNQVFWDDIMVGIKDFDQSDS